MIAGINHVGLSVKNLQSSIHFYCDLLGMEVVRELPFSGELYERILGLEGAKGRVALLKKGTLYVELFEFSYPTPQTKAHNRPVSDHGLSHFCIDVAGLDTMYARLCAAGVIFHSPPVDFYGQAKAAYGRDPDGNIFELLERTDKVSAPTDQVRAS